MAGLLEIMVDAGLKDGQTRAATGNLVFTSAKGAKILESLLEREIERRLGLATDIHVRTAGEWRELVEANPFPSSTRDNPAYVDAVLLRTTAAPGGLERLRQLIKGSERVEVVGRCVYVDRAINADQSKLTLTQIERCLETRGTSRNWNAVLRVAEAL